MAAHQTLAKPWIVFSTLSLLLSLGVLTPFGVSCSWLVDTVVDIPVASAPSSCCAWALWIMQIASRSARSRLPVSPKWRKACCCRNLSCCIKAFKAATADRLSFAICCWWSSAAPSSVVLVALFPLHNAARLRLWTSCSCWNDGGTPTRLDVIDWFPPPDPWYPPSWSWLEDKQEEELPPRGVEAGETSFPFVWFSAFALFTRVRFILEHNATLPRTNNGWLHTPLFGPLDIVSKLYRFKERWNDLYFDVLKKADITVLTKFSLSWTLNDLPSGNQETISEKPFSSAFCSIKWSFSGNCAFGFSLCFGIFIMVLAS